MPGFKGIVDPSRLELGVPAPEGQKLGGFSVPVQQGHGVVQLVDFVPEPFQLGFLEHVHGGGDVLETAFQQPAVLVPGDHFHLEPHELIPFLEGGGLPAAAVPDVLDDAGRKFFPQTGFRTVQGIFCLLHRGQSHGGQGFPVAVIGEQEPEIVFFRRVLPEFHQGQGCISQKVHLGSPVKVLPDFRSFVDQSQVFLHHFFPGHFKRFAEQKALEQAAADVAEKFRLSFGFHPFSQGLDVEVLGHTDHGFHNDLGPVREPAEEFHIQFDGVEGIILQHVQGGVAAAEIVHPQAVAVLAELVQDGGDDAHILDKDAFGDFDGQVPVGDTGPVYPAADFGMDVTIEEIQPGQVEGNGDGGKPQIVPGSVQGADLVHHIQI